MKKYIYLVLLAILFPACRPSEEHRTLSDRQKTPEQIQHEEELHRRQAEEWKRVNEGNREDSRKSAIPPIQKSKTQNPNPNPPESKR